jgi:cytochrome c oxidase cbb3-type subunit III
MKRVSPAVALAFTLSWAFAQASNPFIGNAEAVQQGKAIYDERCTACHGANGGAGERAPAIVIRNSTPAAGERNDAPTLDIIRRGIPGTAMPAWGGRLADDDVLKLVAYIHALRGTAIDNPLPGDPVRGRQIFWGKGGCGNCHMISGRGSVLGPDLTNIATMSKATAISDALTKADHRIFSDGGTHLPLIPPMNYEPVTLMTKDGQTVEGVMLNQDAYSVQLLDMTGKPRSFRRRELSSVIVKQGSLMPTDYDKRLSSDEFNDLLAYLTRLGDPRAAQTRPVTAP